MAERIWSTPFERADVDGMSDEQLAAYLASDEANFHDWADCLACYGFHVQEQRVAAIAALEAGGRGVSEVRGNQAVPAAYAALQSLADAGHIRMLTVWCSELGSMPAEPGHFHGQGATHLPETFAVVPAPGDGWELKRPEPIVFDLRLSGGAS